MGDEDTWSDGLASAYRNPTGRVHISVEADGLWSGTVTLQRQLPGMTSWEDVETYTGDIQEVFQDATPGAQYRIGCAAGNYTAGTTIARLVKESGR